MYGTALCCSEGLNEAAPGAQLFSLSGNFVVPNGVRQLKVWLFGGGGGGPNTQPTGPANVSGGGGGAGGTAYRLITVVPGQVIPYTIGAGGGPAVAGGTSTLTVPGYTLTATGGGRGFNGASAGGAGGVGSGGSSNINGGAGGGGSNANLGGAAGGALNGVNGQGPNSTFSAQAADFQGMRAALAMVLPAVTILGVVPSGCFGCPQVNGANAISFGGSGSGTSAGPNNFGGNGAIAGGGGGGNAGNNTSPSTGGSGARGGVLFAW